VPTRPDRRSAHTRRPSVQSPGLSLTSCTETHRNEHQSFEGSTVYTVGALTPQFVRLTVL
jgi:hypothetical protein